MLTKLKSHAPHKTKLKLIREISHYTVIYHELKLSVFVINIAISIAFSPVLRVWLY